MRNTRKNACDGYHDCIRGCIVGCPPYVSMESKGSDFGDLDNLRDYLAQRYDATSLLQAIRCAYGNEYVAEYGMRNAISSFLLCIRDGMKLDISTSDIDKISDAVLMRGEINY